MIEKIEQLEKKITEITEESKKDHGKNKTKDEKKRTQPEKPFDGAAAGWSDYEWRMRTHLDATYPEEGGRFLDWIAIQKVNIKKADCNEWGFENAKEMDAELWVQVNRITGAEPTNLIRAASLEQTCGAEAWRAVKQHYDHHCRIALDTLRSELFDVSRSKKVEELPELIAKWEVKLFKLDGLLLANRKDPLGDDDKKMVLKRMLPVDVEEELENTRTCTEATTITTASSYSRRQKERRPSSGSRKTKAGRTPCSRWRRRSLRATRSWMASRQLRSPCKRW